MEQNKVDKTMGMLAVGLDFNPSGMPEVNEAKGTFADMIDNANEMQFKTYLGNTLKGMAIRSLIEAQMNVVKLLTFKEE
jgi:hypothetical protein